MTGEDHTHFDRVRQVVARTFRQPPQEINGDSGIDRLPGWDSLGHLTLMMEIEREFAVRFSSAQIGQPKSVMEICQLLQSVQSNG